MTRALAIGLFLLAGEAAAYVRSIDGVTGVCLFWTRRDVPWVLNQKGAADTTLPDLRGALERSFGAWQDVGCSDMTFVQGPLTTRVDAGFDDKASDNINLVIWRERTCDVAVPTGDRCFADGTCADVYDCWEHGGGIIALTVTNYSKRIGVIVDGDIEFNGSPDRSGSEFRFTATAAEGPPCARATDPNCVATDVQNTATHEIGHLLGFDHSPLGEATMFASAPLGETKKRTLSEDDVDALCDVYPAGDRVLTCTPSGTIGIAPTGPSTDAGCGCGGAGTGGLLALLAAMGAARRRSRRS